MIPGEFEKEDLMMVKGVARALAVGVHSLIQNGAFHPELTVEARIRRFENAAEAGARELEQFAQEVNQSDQIDHSGAPEA